MTYTSKKRKELNEAFLRKMKGIQGAHAEESHLFIEALPNKAIEVGTLIVLKDEVPYNVFPWNAVLPVFVPLIMQGRRIYLVNYVNRSAESMKQAAEKLEERGLYYIPGLTMEKGEEYE